MFVITFLLGCLFSYKKVCWWLLKHKLVTDYHKNSSRWFLLVRVPKTDLKKIAETDNGKLIPWLWRYVLPPRYSVVATGFLSLWSLPLVEISIIDCRGSLFTPFPNPWHLIITEPLQKGCGAHFWRISVLDLWSSIFRGYSKNGVF